MILLCLLVSGFLDPLRDGWGSVEVDCWGTGTGIRPPMGRGVCPLTFNQSSFSDRLVAREGRSHVKCVVQRVCNRLSAERDGQSSRCQWVGARHQSEAQPCIDHRHSTNVKSAAVARRVSVWLVSVLLGSAATLVPCRYVRTDASTYAARETSRHPMIREQGRFASSYGLG
jgi:hypothetical protein